MNLFTFLYYKISLEYELLYDYFGFTSDPPTPIIKKFKAALVILGKINKY